METELTVTERFAVVTSLEHGPWRLAGLNDEPLGVRRF